MPDPLRSQRHSIRLPGHDYRAGAYFVTLCSYRQSPLFGRVVGDEVRLSWRGHVVAETWTWLATQYAHVTHDTWLVMPDHLHGILVLDPDAGTVSSGRKPKPLGRLIGAFKTVSTRRINECARTPGGLVWQRNYHERFIRNDRAQERIREYILTNPLRWSLRRGNGSRLPP